MMIDYHYLDRQPRKSYTWGLGQILGWDSFYQSNDPTGRRP